MASLNKSTDKWKVDTLSLFGTLPSDEFDKATPCFVKIAEHFFLLIEGCETGTLVIVMTKGTAEVMRLVNTHHK